MNHPWCAGNPKKKKNAFFLCYSVFGAMEAPTVLHYTTSELASRGPRALHQLLFRSPRRPQREAGKYTVSGVKYFRSSFAIICSPAVSSRVYTTTVELNPWPAPYQYYLNPGIYQNMLVACLRHRRGRKFPPCCWRAFRSLAKSGSFCSLSRVHNGE